RCTEGPDIGVVDRVIEGRTKLLEVRSREAVRRRSEILVDDRVSGDRFHFRVHRNELVVLVEDLERALVTEVGSDLTGERMLGWSRSDAWSKCALALPQPQLPAGREVIVGGGQ